MTSDLDRTKAREDALRDILGLISRSRDNAETVFDAILQRVADLCDAHSAALILGKDGDTHQRMVAHRSAHPATVAMFDRGDVPMDPEVSSSAQAILSRKVIHIHDLTDTESYRRGTPLVVSSVQNSGIRTIMWVPLVTESGGIGCFSIYRKEVRPFIEDEIALVEAFAAQAVIAIENVRQFRELQTRLVREAATREILEVISQSRDDGLPVFRKILKSALHLCEAAVAELFLVTKDRSAVDLVAVQSLTDRPPQVESHRRLFSDTASKTIEAIVTGRVVHIPDITDTERYRNGGPEYRQAFVGQRTTLLVPLMSKGIGIGALCLWRSEVENFTADDIALVETFAAQAVISIENVRQFKALEKLNAELGERVQEQVGEIERMGRLKRFLPAAVADTVISSGSEKMLSSHRALLGVLFCDIRGFTAFCETAEPEETIEVLQTYHEEMGKLIEAHGAGVDHRMGDGIMVLFNDPVPCEDPAGTAPSGSASRCAPGCRNFARVGRGWAIGWASASASRSGMRRSAWWDPEGGSTTLRPEPP